MGKRIAALVSQAAGVVLVVVSVGLWWRWEPAAVVGGLALVAGGALNEGS